jgi:hypothetical protein
MKKILVILILATLTSCSGEWHLKRAIKKGVEWKKDTLTITDTVIRESVYHDTTVVTKPNDTLYFTKDQWHVKIVRINDTLRVQGGCVGDTVIITRQVPVDRIIYKKEFGEGLKNILKWVAVIAAFVIAFLVLWKFK